MAVRRIKVWLLDLPPLFAEMARNALRADMDFDLMTVDEDSAGAGPKVADALLTGRPSADVERLLIAAPGMQAFVVSHDGRMVTWVRMRVAQDELGELTFASLATAVKHSVQQPLH